MFTDAVGHHACPQISTFLQIKSLDHMEESRLVFPRDYCHWCHKWWRKVPGSLVLSAMLTVAQCQSQAEFKRRAHVSRGPSSLDQDGSMANREREKQPKQPKFPPAAQLLCMSVQHTSPPVFIDIYSSCFLWKENLCIARRQAATVFSCLPTVH